MVCLLVPQSFRFEIPLVSLKISPSFDATKDDYVGMTAPTSSPLPRHLTPPPTDAEDMQGEDCRSLYNRVPWQGVRGSVLVITAALLILGLTEPTCLRSVWYHLLEAVASAAFCVEVFWRVRISRSVWAQQPSWELAVEVCCAVVCSLLVLVLIATSSLYGEQGAMQEAVLVILGVAQGWRILVALRTSVEAERDRHVMIVDTRRVFAGSESETAELQAAGQL